MKNKIKKKCLSRNLFSGKLIEATGENIALIIIYIDDKTIAALYKVEGKFSYSYIENITYKLSGTRLCV